MTAHTCNFVPSGRLRAVVAAGVLAVLSPAGLWATPPRSTPPAAAAKQQAVRQWSAMPLTFEPNQGQAPAGVRFVAHGSGFDLYLTESGLWLAAPGQTGGAQLSLRFAGAAAHPRTGGQQRLRAVTNYIFGRDPGRWHTGIPNFAAVGYEGLYPGVNARWHGNHDRLELDLDLAAGTDPAAIQLALAGARQVRLTPSGEIEMDMPGGGLLRLAEPVAYQTVKGRRRTVAVQYVLRGGRLGFRLGAYDHSHPLVIDPVFYSSYFDAPIAAISVGGDGDIYVTGSVLTGFTLSIPVAPNPGAYQTTCATCSTSNAAFVARFDPSQQGAASLVYSTYLGPASSNPSVMPDELGSADGTAITVDSGGDAYVTGSTASMFFPTTPNAAEPAHPGSRNAFVSELGPTGGTLLYSTYLGGDNSGGGGFSNGDFGKAIALDASGNIYVAGVTNSPNLATTGAVQTTLNGESTPFVAALNPSSTQLIYFTYLGGSSSDTVTSLAVDATGDAYVAGSTIGNAFPAFGQSYQPAPAKVGNQTGFLAELGPTATGLNYFTYLGGSTSLEIDGLALDGAGNVDVTGQTRDMNLPTTPGVVGAQSTACPTTVIGPICPNSFVASFNPTAATAALTLNYLTYLGGIEPGFGPLTFANSITTDGLGDVFISGKTSNTDLPLPGTVNTDNSQQPDSALPCAELLPECITPFLIELNANASNVLFTGYLGQTGTAGQTQMTAAGIAFTPSGLIAMAGTTGVGSLPPSPAGNSFEPSPVACCVQGFVLEAVTQLSGASISVSPSSLNFGSAGYPSATLMVKITNTGNQALDISNVASTGPFRFIGTTQCGSPISYIPPDYSCELEIQSSPASSAYATGTITFTDNAPQGTPVGGQKDTYQQTYQLSVGSPSQAPAPTLTSITVTPSNDTVLAAVPLQFTATGHFSDNSTQDLTSKVAWSSSSPVDVTITPAGLATGELASQPTIFAVYSTGITGTTTLTITGTAPSPITDVETITTTDTASLTPPNVETIQVTDTVSVSVYNGLSLNPTPAAFAAINADAIATIGAAYVPVQFTPAGGSGALTVAASGLPAGMNFDQTKNQLSGTVTATAGTYPFTLTLTDGAGNTTGPIAYQLTVVAPAPPTALFSIGGTPVTALNFGFVAPGQTATQQLTLTNSGGTPLTVTSAVVVPAVQFSVDQGCVTTLAPGAQCTMNVTFAPTTYSVSQTAQLQIDDNATASNADPPPAGNQQLVPLLGGGAVLGKGTLTTIAGQAPQQGALGCGTPQLPRILNFSCNYGDGADGTPAQGAALTFPNGIAVAPNGTVYFSQYASGSTENYTERYFTIGGNIATLATPLGAFPAYQATAVADSPTGQVVYAVGQPDAPAVTATTFDSAGDEFSLFSPDTITYEVIEKTAGGQVNTIPLPVDIPGAQATGLAVDGSGYLYTYAVTPQQIVKFLPGQTSSSAVSAPGVVLAGLGSSLVMDAYGDLYVYDGFVEEYFPANGAVMVVAGTSFTPGINYPPGPTIYGPFPATQTALAANGGLALDAAGNLYIADTGNNLIRELAGGQAPTQISWATPAPISYGSPLSATQLNASETTNLPGVFIYSPAGATVLPAGPQTLSVTFYPTDVADYLPSTFSVTLQVLNTPTGSSIQVIPPTPAGLPSPPVSVTFSGVTSPGQTTVTVSNTGPALPAGFQLAANPPAQSAYLDITTTASYTPPITVCINYSALGFTSAANLALMHSAGGAAFANVTISVDSPPGTICGSVLSLSPFVLATTTTPVYHLSSQLAGPFTQDGNGNFVAKLTVTNTGTLNLLGLTASSAVIKVKQSGGTVATTAAASGTGSLGNLVPGQSTTLTLVFPASAAGTAMAGAPAIIHATFAFTGSSGVASLLTKLP